MLLYSSSIIVHNDQGQAVARTTVTVSKPEVTLASVNLTENYFEITNGAAQEINLGEWRIVKNNGDHYTLPGDTIIAGGATVKVPLAPTKLSLSSGDTLALTMPNGKELGQIKITGSIAISTDPARAAKIKELSARLETAKALLAQLQNDTPKAILAVTPESSSTLVANQQLASAGQVQVLARKPGWWQSVLSWFK